MFRVVLSLSVCLTAAVLSPSAWANSINPGQTVQLVAVQPASSNAVSFINNTPAKAPAILTFGSSPASDTFAALPEASVPEPATLGLLTLACATVAHHCTRRKPRKA
jgi:hypothetical protein